MNQLLKLIYTTKKGEELFSEPGNKDPKDKRLYIGYKGHKWAHTLELIGAALRAKAYVEDVNYPNGRGKHMLLDFVQQCILTKTPIKELCKKFRIPE
jgi:hypothetical protein